jgi:SAM-dependent methyltransferase
MAITRHLAELILAEHSFRPIRGDVLLLGRQLVVMTPDEAQALVEKAGIKISPHARIDYDKTPHPFSKKLISDASFFSLFTDAVVKASDVSDYEGAEIVFDLSDSIPSSLNRAFDFIYNGSVLDNVFDPAACIRNISKMLRSDGVVFHYEGAAHSSPAYLKFSPDWFFDYYALNGFADFQSYIVTYGDVHVDPWSVYEWSAFAPGNTSQDLTMPMRLGAEAMVVAIAQNAPTATIDRIPLQNVYRSGEHENYRLAFDRYSKSGRRETIKQVFQHGASLPRKRSAHQEGFVKAAAKMARSLFVKEAKPILPPGHVYLGSLGSPEFLGQ